MKLIDYGIAFSMITICFMCVWGYNEKLLVLHSMTNTQVNDTMDEIVRDSLEKTIIEMYEKHGEPDYITDLPEYKELLMENLRTEMEFVMLGTGNYDGKRSVEERVSNAFLVWGEYMYVYEDGSFSEIALPMEGTMERYFKIISVMEAVCGYSLSIPLEDYEKNNKIGDYSFTVIYSAYRGNRKGRPYVIKCFSSAKLSV